MDVLRIIMDNYTYSALFEILGVGDYDLQEFPNHRYWYNLARYCKVEEGIVGKVAKFEVSNEGRKSNEDICCVLSVQLINACKLGFNSALIFASTSRGISFSFASVAVFNIARGRAAIAINQVPVIARQHKNKAVSTDLSTYLPT